MLLNSLSVVAPSGHAHLTDRIDILVPAMRQRDGTGAVGFGGKPQRSE